MSNLHEGNNKYFANFAAGALQIGRTVIIAIYVLVGGSFATLPSNAQGRDINNNDRQDLIQYHEVSITIRQLGNNEYFWNYSRPQINTASKPIW